MTDFREGGAFLPPHPSAAPKKPIPNRVKIACVLLILSQANSILFFIAAFAVLINTYEDDI